MTNDNNNEDKPVRITQKEIYETLTRIEREVITLSQLEKITTDHEGRIRELEKAVWKSSWISGLISAITTSAATAFIITTLTES
jgi:hypothetical protein